MIAHETIAIQPTEDPRFEQITVTCSECPYAWHYVREVGEVEPANGYIFRHRYQHEPDRALDVVVDWTPHAQCSVCADNGNIEWGERRKTIRCQNCGTTWKLDGTDGRRRESADDD